MDEDEEFTNEYDLISEEDIARIIASENGPWTEMTVEEAIAHNRKLCGRDNGENDESE
jgi:hypothetical protein